MAGAGGFITKVAYYAASKVLVVGMRPQFLISIELLKCPLHMAAGVTYLSVASFLRVLVPFTMAPCS